MFIYGWNLDISLKKCIVFCKYFVLLNFSFRVIILFVNCYFVNVNVGCMLFLGVVNFVGGGGSRVERKNYIL